MAENRDWMYKRLSGTYLNPEFVNGVHSFLNFAFCDSSNENRRCPCSKCTNRYYHSRREITEHLYSRGFVRGYYVWDSHGEQRSSLQSTTNSAGDSSNLHVGREENINAYTDMVFDAFQPEFGRSDFDNGEEPNPEAKAFFDLLHDSNVEIYKGSKKTVLGFVSEWMHTKQYKNATESMAEGFLVTALNNLVSPEVRHLVPDSMYKINQMMMKLGLPHETIDVCYNNCFLYYKGDAHRTVCPHCHEPRYEKLSSGNYTARKKLWYMPIAPRLQRLYMARGISEHMTWHTKCAGDSDRIIHPAGAEAWKHFDRKHPEFAAEPRNVRLGLCTDGFSPFSMASSSYSCWPVFVTPFNLPPDMCMQQEYIFLSLIISGPEHPGKSIDVLLRPLIDELKMLWETGVETYDSYRKQNFQMRVMVLWTISDFPAYGMLSGWGTHGRMSCPCCMEETKAFQLEHGGKTTFFDCHRQFLPMDHAFRRNNRDFLKGEIEVDNPPQRRSGEEILHFLLQLELNSIQFGKHGKNPTGYCDWHNWTKISIFWELPYWSSLLIRHMLDVMHIERNVFENIRHTVMDDPQKTKDNAKARRDLALLTRRSELFLKKDNRDKEYKPKATYTLTKDQKRIVCLWLMKLRFPDGYASNISRRVKVEQGRLIGLKSHDCHVFMQRLLPIAFRDFLPDNIWGALTEVSNFFRAICASEIRVSDMEALEQSIVVTMCKLEKIFPPGFFDCMEHLMIHLPYEAKVRGPVQYGWMYPFERRMFELKRSVFNKARVPGSICKSYLRTEIANLTAHYFPDNVDIETKLNTLKRNEVVCGPTTDTQLPIFTTEGRPIGSKLKHRVLTTKEYNAAQLYILMNCGKIDHWLSLFEREIGADYLRPSEIARRRTNEFIPWLKKLVSTGCDVGEDIRSLVVGPLRSVDVYKGYMVNGFRFHTEAHGQGKKTMNSGVCVMATTDALDESNFYGMLQEVIELELWGSGRQQKIVLFKCDWYDIDKGLVVHPKYHLVDINPQRKLPDTEPFIFATQATQVYYVPYPAQHNPKRKGWWAVCPIKARHFIDVSSTKESEVQQDNARPIYQENDPPIDEAGDDPDLDSPVNLSSGTYEAVRHEPDDMQVSDEEEFDPTLGLHDSDLDDDDDDDDVDDDDDE